MERVQDHYAAAGAGAEIADRLVSAMREMAGADAAVTAEALAPFDHFHGRGIVATREMAALLEAQPDEAVLDIGCGIGGPARWLAATTGCMVTGIDLTPEFCAAARELNARCGLAQRVAILEGSATALPVPDAGFDRAYSQNVVMNIADKAGVYREACRALKRGGRLVLSNLAAGSGGPPHFPAPWATRPENSFLATEQETRRDLQAVGFEILSFHDTTATSIEANGEARRRAEATGKPPPGPGVIMGLERFREMQANMARSYNERRLHSVEIVARKP